jgi:GNAT superfamily N-acetyltransferase
MNERSIEVEPRLDADATLEIRDGLRVAASLSLWWTRTPALDGERVGFVGDYTCADARAARALLDAACRRLRSAGCTLAIGPVDGTTQKRYRFVTQRGARARFLLEPDNPDAYPLQVQAAGFRPFAAYVSAIETLADESDARTQRAAARIRASGVTIRPFDPACFERELDALYDVACAAFASSLLFAPLERAAFHALYAPLRGQIDPDFVRIAEHDGRAVGFAFGILDRTALERGAPLDTLVGKTQARLPERRYAGLGAALLDDVRRRARERGLRHIIHALIRDDNVARATSARTAAIFRRYALFARNVA